MATYFTIAAVAYLLGSVPFGYLLVRGFRGHDIRESGSGNIGATNVARYGAKRLAVATFVLDAAKGFCAVLAAKLIWVSVHGRPWVMDCWLCNDMGQAAMFAAMCAVVGHMFPVWLGFKGGKGVATGLGAMVQIDAIALLGSLLAFGIAVAIGRFVSVGSMVAAALFPALMLTVGFGAHLWPSGAWPILVISILIILKHHANIRRLLAGSEPRFEWRRS